MTNNGSVTYTYDAENRIISNNPNGTYSYIYDGDGERVAKCTPPSGSTLGTCPSGSTGTLYWRGNLQSDALSETDLAGNIQNTYIFFNGLRIARNDSSGNQHYYFSDHLGTHGVVENATGTVCEQDIDYYPYGGVQTDYCPTVAQNYKFTGKERDSESGLDMFGARYYGSSLGRFMTPDWAAKPANVPYADFGNPQSLNLYSHVNNNPTTTRDPDGHCPPCLEQALEQLDNPAVQEALDNATGILAAGIATGYAYTKGWISEGANVLGNAMSHGQMVGIDPVFDTNYFLNKSGQSSNTQAGGQAAPASQSTPAQPPGNGNGKYDENSPDNQERMTQGKAPIGQDGKPIELHHEGQSHEGQLTEMTQTEHRGGDNFQKNHPNTGQKPSQIDRNKFRQERQQYWKDKAKKKDQD